MDLQISIRESGDVTILDLQGRATIGADSDLLNSHLQKLVANGVRKLLLNLAGVTQLDSSGISAIIGTYVSLSRQGGSLKLLCPWGRVRAVLRVIRLPDIIPTFEDETQALASFQLRVTLLSPDGPSFVEAPTTRTSSRGFSFGFIGALFRLFSMVNFELVYHVKQSFFNAVT